MKTLVTAAIVIAGALICGADQEPEGAPNASLDELEQLAKVSMNIGAVTTWYVDDDNCPEPGSGTEADPLCLIQDCIDAAMEGDECVVAPGTYFETINFLGKAITLRSSDGPDVTTIDADASGTVITCDSSEGPNTVIDGFTLTGGTGTDLGNGFLRGGGMYNVNSSPSVTNCTFSGNTASFGGGMFNFFSDPRVTNCTFSGNSADFRGGGISNQFSNPTVTDCTFCGNDAKRRGGGMSNGQSNPMVTNCAFGGNTADSGGGMYNFSTNDSTVSNCTFSGNAADFGGGMLNDHSSLTVTNCMFGGNHAEERGGGMLNFGHSPTVTDCTFSGNTARDGGGMLNFSNGNSTVNKCRFSGNAANNFGGGMSNFNSDPTVTNCTFSGNVADFGGGIMNGQSSPSVTNCTFSGNDAEEHGGGMYNFSNSSPSVSNCTFSGNSTTFGGGGMSNFNNSTPTVTNCILWNDSPNEISGVATVNYCDVEGGLAGIGNIGLAPLFVEFGFWDDNGTPGIPDDDFWVEGDYHLLPGSPCIDAGDSTAVPEGIMTDLDGNPRFVDDPNTDDTGLGDPPIVDMGAYEVQDPCADDDGDGRVTICHVPPGNPDNIHTITVSVNAIPAHLAHGDHCGPCAGERSTGRGAGRKLDLQGEINTPGSVAPVLRERGP